MTSFWYAELMYFGLSFVANYYNNMGLIINHHNESIQFSRLKNLVTHGDTIRIISSDGVTMNVSKFMLTFFGDIFQHDQDCIITPIESSILSVIVDLLNLKKYVDLVDSKYYKLLGLDTKGLKSVWEILNPKIGQNVRIKKVKSAGNNVVKEGGMSPISDPFSELPSFIKVVSIKHDEDKNSEIQTSLQQKANEHSKDEELHISFDEESNKKVQIVPKHFDSQSVKSKSSDTLILNGEEYVYSESVPTKAMETPEACHQSQVNENLIKDEELPGRSNEDEVINVYKDQEIELAVQMDDVTFKICQNNENEKLCQNNENETQVSNKGLTEAVSNIKANNRKEQNREKRIKTKKRSDKDNKDNRKRDKYHLYGDPIFTKMGGKVITVECKLCGKIFDRKQYSDSKPYVYYKSHFLKHHILTKNCCDYDLSGETKQQKVKHFYIVHLEFLGCTENENCHKVFRTEKALKDHAKLHKITNDKCDKCEFTSPFPRHLRHHKERMHDVTKNLLLKLKKDEIFECSECKIKPFPSERGLIYHKLQKHNPEECKDCGKELVGAAGMKKHVASFHCAEESMKFHCDRCGKGFVDSTRLNHHVDSIHLGVVFYCRYPICDKKLQPYRNAENRASHERKRHGQNYNVFLRQKENQDNVNLSNLEVK